MKRRNFIQNSAQASIALTLLGAYSCKNTNKKEATEAKMLSKAETVAAPLFKISLAQWSIHRMIRKEGLNPYAFAEKAKSWGFTGLEYVSGLYYDELEKDDFSPKAMQAFVNKCNAESQKHGLENLLIVIDGQGDLASPDDTTRKEAVENHYKWVDAAAAMGCHSIRVNLSGTDDAEKWTKASVDGLTQLATYAKDKNINIIVENHGGHSSNGAMLANVMKQVNMSNCGTLPDFGNFCIKWKKWPECEEAYDKYKGMAELMPYAKAVSAKSYDFDSDGNETEIDYAKIMQIVKDSGYQGYIGVEYEGERLGEEKGILATKDLLAKLIG